MRVHAPWPLLVLVMFSACQTLTEESPQGATGPSAPGAPQVPAAVVPVQIPSPTAGAPPATQPPATAPAPSNPAPSNPSTASCRPPTGNPRCGKGPSSFQADVDAALELLVQRRPDIFNMNDRLGDIAFKVVKVQDYVDGAVANVQARGLCARWNGEELQVKDPGNQGDDAYDILTGGNYMWRGPGSYKGNCAPASF